MCVYHGAFYVYFKENLLTNNPLCDILKVRILHAWVWGQAPVESDRPIPLNCQRRTYEMNKIEFLTELKMALAALPPDDVDAAIDYYSEVIDDSVDAGLSPVAAVALLPTPEELAKKILSTEVPRRSSVGMHNRRESMYESPKRAPRRKRRAWEWILLAVAIPFLLVFAAAALILLFAVSLAGFAFLILLYALNLALAAVGVMGMVISPFSAIIHGSFPLFLLLFGIALFSLGSSLLLFACCKALTVQIIRLNRYLFHRGRAKFHERRTTV